jgi:hypothetical protein
MKQSAGLAVLVLTLSLTVGCVERRYTINSDPPGALVYRNNSQCLGYTPVDDYIVYYGKYKFTLVKDGYEPLEVIQKYPPPWYEFPGLDFLSENVWPFKLRDVRCFHYQLQPMKTVQANDVRQRAEELRQRGAAIGVPREPRPIGPVVPGPGGVTPAVPPAETTLPPPQVLPPGTAVPGPAAPPKVPPPPPVMPQGPPPVVPGVGRGSPDPATSPAGVSGVSGSRSGS